MLTIKHFACPHLSGDQRFANFRCTKGCRGRRPRATPSERQDHQRLIPRSDQLSTAETIPASYCWKDTMVEKAFRAVCFSCENTDFRVCHRPPGTKFAIKVTSSLRRNVNQYPRPRISSIPDRRRSIHCALLGLANRHMCSRMFRPQGLPQALRSRPTR